MKLKPWLFLRLFADNRLVISQRISMSLYTADIPEVMEACGKHKQRGGGGGVLVAQRTADGTFPLLAATWTVNDALLLE